MSLGEWTLGIVDNIVWPAVVFAIGFLFRSSIREMLSGEVEITGPWGTSARFGERIRTVRHQLDASTMPPPEPPESGAGPSMEGGPAESWPVTGPCSALLSHALPSNHLQFLASEVRHWRAGPQQASLLERVGRRLLEAPSPEPIDFPGLRYHLGFGEATKVARASVVENITRVAAAFNVGPGSPTAQLHQLADQTGLGSWRFLGDAWRNMPDPVTIPERGRRRREAEAEALAVLDLLESFDAALRLAYTAALWAILEPDQRH